MYSLTQNRQGQLQVSTPPRQDSPDSTCLVSCSCPLLNYQVWLLLDYDMSNLWLKLDTSALHQEGTFQRYRWCGPSQQISAITEI